MSLPTQLPLRGRKERATNPPAPFEKGGKDGEEEGKPTTVDMSLPNQPSPPGEEGEGNEIPGPYFGERGKESPCPL